MLTLKSANKKHYVVRRGLILELKRLTLQLKAYGTLILVFSTFGIISRQQGIQIHDHPYFLHFPSIYCSTTASHASLLLDNNESSESCSSHPSFFFQSY